jgi:hypothetical protein
LLSTTSISDKRFRRYELGWTDGQRDAQWTQQQQYAYLKEFSQSININELIIQHGMNVIYTINL